MGAPINTPSTGDIWNLSIDDLLAPLPETQRLGGTGPFVINLSASSAPIDVPKGIAGCERVHVFLVQRIEDRRPRYRLRLGPFVTEDEAEAALEKVRTVYPGALTATADAEDLRAMAARQAKSGALQPQAEKPRQTTTVTPAAAEIIPSNSLLAVAADSSASAPTSSAAIPTVTMMVPTPTRTPTPTAKAVPAVPSAPTAVTAPKVPAAPAAVTAPKVPAAPAAVTAPKVPAAPAAVTAPKVVPPIAKARLPTASAAAPTVKSAVPPAQQPVPQIKKPLPNLDATQTVRALTQLELEDDQASLWFVIQLALAEDAFDPDALPNLDIFAAYRLYSVAGIDQGQIVHALRMGFFSEEVGARAVASYLAAYYDNPTIKRVSAAERQRFADQRLEPRKDVGATGRQAVIEITNERFVRERKSAANVSKKSR
jgi:hypothetical protein